MLFSQLAAVLQQKDLTAVSMTISATAEGLSVLMVPKSKKTGEDAAGLAQPLQLSGTAAELDEGFAALLTSFAAKRQSLLDQLEATEQIIDAAKKASVAKATKSTRKPTPGGASKPDADDDEGLTCSPSGDEAAATAEQAAGEPNLFA